jgi:hypothetical protein
MFGNIKSKYLNKDGYLKKMEKNVKYLQNISNKVLPS